MKNYDAVIIGGGPAGCTAGLYCSRAGLKSLLIERGAVGGQIANASLVDNYPGFPQGVSGSELASLMHQQAARYDLEIVTADVTDITQEDSYVISTSEGSFGAEALIVAAGSEYRTLQVPGEGRLSGHGVSYCATCDGFFFRNKTVAVIGGGDTAITDALELGQHASKVYVVHRRDELRAGKALQQRAFAHPKLEFVWSNVVEEVLGDTVVRGIRLRNAKTGLESVLDVDGVFVAVGITPNSQIFSHMLECDADGSIVTDGTMSTPSAGVFAAGDIRRNSPRQVSTAVGDGATAAMSAFKYLKERE
ncbi:MAG: thioredoxin-disulfide reductase [Dehalococcoidia bacterium]|nr:thioredoxin-disulfide reductase [Dehalococcoidia bacterium]